MREIGRVRSVGHSQDYAASRRRILASRLAISFTSCPDAPSVNHFVWPDFLQNPVQAASAGPLLRDESNSRRPALLRLFQSFGNMQQCIATKPITNSGPRPSLAYHKMLALQRDIIEDVHSRGAHFLAACRTDIHVHLIQIGHFGRVQAQWLQVDRESRENTRNSLPVPRHHPDWLRSMQQIKDWIRRSLWQTLDAQEPIWRNPADDVARLVDRRNEEPVRRAAAQRHVNVAQIVCFRCKSF